jgi:hypothetical protein
MPKSALNLEKTPDNRSPSEAITLLPRHESQKSQKTNETQKTSGAVTPTQIT